MEFNFCEVKGLLKRIKRNKLLQFRIAKCYNYVFTTTGSQKFQSLLSCTQHRTQVAQIVGGNWSIFAFFDFLVHIVLSMFRNLSTQLVRELQILYIHLKCPSVTTSGKGDMYCVKYCIVI